MSFNDIPENVQRLVSRHIESVKELEVLLLLYEKRQKEWTAEEIARELYIGVDSVGRWLDRLEAAGLLARGAASQEAYRYNTSSALDQSVHELANTYARMRLRVIDLIYSNPHEHIQSFADAFKFRKDKE